jgi:xanthine dehydrogenase accessory factor
VKRTLLERIAGSQRRKYAVVLLRALDSGSQWLFDPQDHEHSSEVPEALRPICAAALRRDGASVVEVEGAKYLVQTLSPPHRLIVVGAVHIAQILLPMAQAAGFAGTLIDPRPAFASVDRFPGVDVFDQWPQDAMNELALDDRTAVVTLSHDPKIDEPALAAALNSEAFYIGALGSRRNHAGRRDRLAALGFSPEIIDRIHAPVGLDLGGRAPAEIAVAILAQIIQTRYRGTASAD